MKILIAPDKFKGSLSSAEVCDAIEEGLFRRNKNYTISKIPVADGGEGTCDILTMHARGRNVGVSVLDPLGRIIEAYYGISGDGARAFIEMAAASGLHLLRGDERNPAYTSTVGTGMMIRHAISQGVTEIILGIGGSATNDAGMGMASALGFDFRTATGWLERPKGKDLIDLIEIRRTVDYLANVKVTVLCDVNNPLYGPLGAAFVFAPQKGADPAGVEVLDAGLKNFARVVKQTFSLEPDFPGAGAGGGMGAGARIFLGAKITSGIDYIINFLDLEEKISTADVIISGEGKLDQQSLSGKVVAGISKICLTHNKPLVIVSGKSELSPSGLKSIGCLGVITLMNDRTSEDEAISSARQLLEDRVYEEFPF